jgi:serine protease Do
MTQMWRSRVAHSRALSFLLLAAVPTALFVTMPAPVRAADVFEPTSDEVNSVVERAKPAVVQVRSGKKFILAGSGFFIDDRGTVLTSSSVLGENTGARVVINGVEMDAKIIGNDPRSGLAMLRVSFDASPSLPLGHTNDLKTGNNVIMVGYPLNLPASFAQGPVNGFEISYLAMVDGESKGSLSAVERFATTHIHANVAISPGQVGGPLLNAQGEVVGLVATREKPFTPCRSRRWKRSSPISISMAGHGTAGSAST